MFHVINASLGDLNLLRKLRKSASFSKMLPRRDSRSSMRTTATATDSATIVPDDASSTSTETVMPAHCDAAMSTSETADLLTRGGVVVAGKAAVASKIDLHDLLQDAIDSSFTQRPIIVLSPRRTEPKETTSQRSTVQTDVVSPTHETALVPFPSSVDVSIPCDPSITLEFPSISTSHIRDLHFSMLDANPDFNSVSFMPLAQQQLVIPQIHESPYRSQLAEARAQQRVLQSALDMQKTIARHEYLQSQALAAKLQDREDELEKMRELLHIQDQEMRTPKTAKDIEKEAPSWTVADIICEVEALNDDIWDIAMEVGDAVLECRKQLPSESPPPAHEWEYERFEEEAARRERRRREDLEIMAHRWGGIIVERLLLDLSDGDTALLECLIANIIVERCEEIFVTFCDGPGNAELDARLAELWEEIRESHGQESAKTWLSLTLSQLKGRRRDDSRVMQDFYRLLELAGVPRKERLGAQIGAMLREETKTITGRVLEIKEMCVQCSQAGDIAMLVVDRGGDFDPETMQSVVGPDGPEASHSGQVVSCSTGLGVVRYTESEEAGWDREILLKSDVLLASVLEG